MAPKSSGGTHGKATALLDLDALVQPVGQVRRFGKVFDVLPLDGVSQQIFAQLADRNKSGETIPMTEQIDAGLSILGQVLPGMPEEERKRLSAEEQLKIIVMAGTAIERVQEFIQGQEGNGRRPTPKGQAPAGSR